MSQGTNTKALDNVVSMTDEVKEAHIMDLDFHLEISEDELLPYIDDRHIAKKIETQGLHKTREGNGTYLPYANHDPSSNTHHGSAGDADEISAVMKDYGLDETVVTPTNHLPTKTTNYPVVSTEIVKAYNDYVADQVIDVDRGVYANAVIPYWDPETAAQEIERMSDNKGIVSGFNHISPELWGGKEFDPIYEALVNNHLPLTFHAGGITLGSSLMDSQARTFIEGMFAGFSALQISHPANLIATGVFEKFPELNVVYLEAGQQWLPYLANRMDDEYQIFSKDFELTPRLKELDQKYLNRMPSEYVWENMYVSTQPIALPKRRDEAEAVLKACHADETFVFSTDWPHHATDITNWPFEQAGIDDDLRERILHENAEEAYRLPR